MPTIKVPKQENQTLKSSDDIVNAINNADPRTNTYMPLSAGVESTAALIYTQRDPDMHPFCVYWYDQRYGMFSDAMAFYTQKQAEFYNLPYGNDKSMLSVLPHTREVPIIVSGLSSFMSVVLGAPGGIKFKWFMMGANAEDDMRMRLQFREYRKIMALYMSDCLDGTGVKLSACRETPEVRNPLEFLTKSEMYALIMREEPKMLELLWTCILPKGEIRKNGKLVGYEACNVCYKCQELEQAKKTAVDGVFRYQEGIKYFSTISKDMK